MNRIISIVYAKCIVNPLKLNEMNFGSKIKNILPIILDILTTACGSTKKQHDMNSIPAPIVIYKTQTGLATTVANSFTYTIVSEREL